MSANPQPERLDEDVPRARRWTAQELKARVESMIQKELARCERSMSAADWAEHREWVTANVVEGARIWLRQTAERGEL